MNAPLKGGVFAHHMHFDVAPAAFPPHERSKCPAALPPQRSIAELKEQLRAGAAASGAHFEGKLRQQRARPLYVLLTTYYLLLTTYYLLLTTDYVLLTIDY